MLDECLARPAAATAEDRHYWGSAFGLAACREPRAFDRLVRMVREPRGITRQHTAAALGRFGDRRAIPALLEALAGAGDDRRLHHAVALALAALGAESAVPALLAEFSDADMLNIAYRAAEAAGKLGEPARASLLAALGDPDAQVRACAVLGLEALGGAPVVGPLLSMLTDPDHLVRWQAALALGELGDRRAAPALEAAQADPDAEVRKVVASALRKLGGREGPRLPAPGPGRWVLTVATDYSQILVGDSAYQERVAPAEFWGKEAFERGLAVDQPGLLGISTVRQFGDVPVVVERFAGPPPLDPDAWDRIIEASLALPSGRLLLDEPLSYQGGETEPRPDGHASPHVDVPPGLYRLRIHYGGQETLYEDHYWLALWPQEPYAPPRVLKPLSAPAVEARPTLPALLHAADRPALVAALRHYHYSPMELQAALDLAVELALATHQPAIVDALLSAGANFDAWSRAHPHAARRFRQLVEEYHAVLRRPRPGVLPEGRP